MDVAHPHKPLIAHIRLDRRLAADRCAPLRARAGSFGDEAQLLQIRQHLLPRGRRELQADIRILLPQEFPLAVFVDFAIGGQEVDLFQPVAAPVA